MSTIFALSSGAPPAGIAIIRVSGPQAGNALELLTGKVPKARRASMAAVRNRDGQLLDRALVVWFPGPGTVTGEDLAEFHLHGGRAVVSAVEEALASLPGLLRAEPGAFTRRAFANGRIDLAEAEGLADLLSAETELQRQSAMLLADGALSMRVDEWRESVLILAAQVEAVLDFGDEDDVGGLPAGFAGQVSALGISIQGWLDSPRAERLREGYRVVLAGPPNSGKSTLFNALVDDEAAITSPTAGTTRDVIERAVSIEGVPFSFLDTAGLRDSTDDAIERVGIERATAALARADCVLWLGQESRGPDAAWEIEARIDDPSHYVMQSPRHRISANTGEGVDALKRDLAAHARTAMPKPGQVALNARQYNLMSQARNALDGCAAESDLLLAAEQLRTARVAFDNLTGRASTEDMLDALFGRFCIGK